jgi:hypothetical protein
MFETALLIQHREVHLPYEVEEVIQFHAGSNPMYYKRLRRKSLSYTGICGALPFPESRS